MLNHIATLKKEQLEKSDLISVFANGYKSETVMQEKRTGIEFEKLPVLNDSFKAAPYFQVKKFLESFKDEHWQGVFENDSLLGLKSENAVISLEPGSQTEISFNPITNLLDSQKSLAVYNKKTAQIANKFGIKWLGYGIQPVSTYGSINIIPKKRYEYMTKYLPTVAKRPLVMMRETSGIQASFDYQNEQDAMTKFGFALKFSPIVSAMFANSPVRNGRLTKFKSNRAASWLDTDNDRCGLVSPKAFSEDFTFEDYVQILLDVPMIFIERKIDGKKVFVKVENRTFRQFLKEGYQGFYANMQDWETHLSLYFPDVRFKSYIEIRNHDNQRSDLICAVPALWKGLVYNQDAMDTAKDIVKQFTYFDFAYLRRKTPQYGLDMKIKGMKLADIARELVNISYESLKSFGKGEEILLEPLKNFTAKGLTPADIIIDKWTNEWNGNIAKLVEYSELK